MKKLTKIKRVMYRSLSHKKCHKNKMKRWVSILGHIFWKNCKNSKLKLQDLKKPTISDVLKVINQKRCFSVQWLLFKPFCNIIKYFHDYIDPSGHLVFYETSPRRCSRCSPGGWIAIFFTELVDDYHRKIQWIILIN